MESLAECKSQVDRITFEDFKKLMKGQQKEVALAATTDAGRASQLLPPKPRPTSTLPPIPSPMSDEGPGHRRQRSASFQHKLDWAETSESSSRGDTPSLAIKTGAPPGLSPLASNRALYRRHREMRLAVLEASKQFDKKRTDLYHASSPVRAGLIMKRGTVPPIEVQDAHTQEIFAMAAKRCGRSRPTRSKTVSDVTGMMPLSSYDQ